MKIWLLSFILSFTILNSGWAQGEQISPVSDALELQGLPKSFQINYDLRLSGSCQITQTSLPYILSELPQSREIVIVDLRRESHGLINGIPVSWIIKGNQFVNLGLTVQEILDDEKQRLLKAKEEGVLILNENGLMETVLHVEEVLTEKDYIESLKIKYVRIPVVDTQMPGIDEVDLFVQFVRNLKHDSWIHFHCKMGGGRTNTFIIMYTMILNGNRLSLEEYLPDNFEVLRPKKYQFFKSFYEYCLENMDLQVNFSEWYAACKV